MRKGGYFEQDGVSYGVGWRGGEVEGQKTLACFLRKKAGVLLRISP